MRKIIERVKTWLREFEERRQSDREKRMRGVLSQESVRRIQVMEYAGELYMSFDGVPLVSEHALRDNVKLADYVADCRETWMYWQQERFDGEIVLHIDRSGGVK